MWVLHEISGQVLQAPEMARGKFSVAGSRPGRGAITAAGSRGTLENLAFDPECPGVETETSAYE